MEAGIQTLETIFLPNIQYQIPTFQRPYVWTEETQWKLLWENVRDTAKRYLDEQRRVGPDDDAATLYTPPHFLGAIVLQQQSTATGRIWKRDIIDGQQRLTTLQILLDATQEVFETIAPESARRLAELVLNDSRLFDGNSDHAFKVWPTLLDREAFRQVMHNNQTSDAYKETKIAKAHNFFKSKVEDWVKGDQVAAQALESTIMKLLHLVVIDLSTDDDQYVIFETLNARGTPLLQADLIKNFILQEAVQRRQDADTIHSTYLSKLEDSWWRKDVPQGRLVRPRIDVFFNHWVVMNLGEEIAANKVFSTFRDYVSGRSITKIAQDIDGISDVYQKIQDSSILGKILYRWRGTLAPVLMYLFSSDIPEPQLSNCLRIIESFLARRMIRKMTTANYNMLFLALLRRLREHPGEPADATLVQFLHEQKAWGRIWPDDQLLESDFIGEALYNKLTKWSLRLVLENIEEHLRSPMTEESKVQGGLTIEHVMPQKWSTNLHKNWPLNDTEDPAAAEQRRNHLIHTIGNLTLVNQPLNSKLSNDRWMEKRQTLDKYSVLRLKDSLTVHDEWNEEKIKARSKYLAGIAAEVWPHAEAWRKRLNA